jgi:hypothetical protein
VWERLDADDPVTASRRASQRVARVLALGVTGLFWLIATAWQPWRLFERAGFSADFYDEQARAFLRGRLHVDPTVAGVEGFVIGDLTYLYYGPALAVARMPTALFGRGFDGRLALVSMLIALIVLGTWSYRLMNTVSRALGHRPAGPWRTALFVGAVMASPVLFLAGWISVYHETELWACTFAVIAATCLLELLDATEPSTRWWAGAAAATIATVLTRASVGVGVALAALVVAMAIWRRSRPAGDWTPSLWLATAAVGGVVAHMGLNTARFGSLLGLPAERQVLSLIDPDRAAWFAGNDGSFFSVRFLPTTLGQYLRPDAIRLERLVPGIRFGPLAPDLGSYPVETTTPASSITATAPVLVLLALVGIVWLVRRRRWVEVAVVAGLAAGAVPSFTIGFIANRYLVDLMPMLVVPAAVGIHVVPRPVARANLVRVLVVAAVVWGVWVNASLATWTLGLKSAGFTELRYRIDAVLFPSPRPGLIDLEPSMPVPRDGVVALAPECAGVYVAEQGAWVALERAVGRRVVGGTVRTDTEVIAAGGGWVLSLVDPGPAALVRLSVDGATVAELEVGRLVPGDPVEVVADPVTRDFFIETPERIVFFDPGVPGDDDALVAIDLDTSGIGSTGASARLCRVLDERR